MQSLKERLAQQKKSKILNKFIFLIPASFFLFLSCDQLDFIAKNEEIDQVEEIIIDPVLYASCLVVESNILDSAKEQGVCYNFDEALGFSDGQQECDAFLEYTQTLDINLDNQSLKAVVQQSNCDPIVSCHVTTSDPFWNALTPDGVCIDIEVDGYLLTNTAENYCKDDIMNGSDNFLGLTRDELGAQAQRTSCPVEE